MGEGRFTEKRKLIKERQDPLTSADSPAHFPARDGTERLISCLPRPSEKCHPHLHTSTNA